MKLRHIYLTIGAAAASILPFGAAAQYNPSIDVEGEYKPDVIAQERINTFPKPLRTGNLDSRLDYDLEGIVTGFAPQGVPMAATGWGDTRRPLKNRGWLDLALGSWLDARLSAGYRFVNTPSTLVQAWIRHNSTSLWQPLKKQADGGHDWRRYLYDETIGADLRQRFDDRGILSASVSWNFADFNYYGFMAGEADPAVEDAPEQRFNDVRVKIGWKSEGDRKFLPYAGIGVRYTGYRRHYSFPWVTGWADDPDDAPVAPTYLDNLTGGRETALDIDLGFEARPIPVSTIGLDLSGSLVFTSGLKEKGWESYAPHNYGLVTISPYFRLRKGIADFRIGPRIDLGLATGCTGAWEIPSTSSPTEDEYPYKRLRFYAAPDVRLLLSGSNLALDLQVRGGARAVTLASIRERDFYCRPGIFNTTPEYSPLDATLRLGFGPFAGFHGEVKAAYRIVRGQRLGGWYAYDLSYLYPGDENQDNSMIDYYLNDEEAANVAGYSIGLALSYEYSPWLSLRAEGAWQPQHGKTTYFNGYDLPEFTGRFSIGSNPWKRLELGLDFDLRASRRPLYRYSETIKRPNGEVVISYDLANMKMDDWMNLSFHAGYGITETMRVGVELNNLLNRRQEILPGLPVPGITAAATFSWQF